MNFTTINKGAYNLHFIKTKKFKTITIDINFYREIKKEEITKRNLLKMVLLDSSKNYKSEKDLIIESENLYDIKVSSQISRIGSFSNLSFQTKFLNEKYTEKGMNEESIIFFLDLLFNPNVKDNAFVSIDKQKDKLRQDIESLKDNKPRLANLKLLEKIKGMPYSLNTFGYIDDLDKIDNINLYEYYKDVLDKDQIDIFVLGDIDTSLMKDLFNKYFIINTFKKENKSLLVPELVKKKRITRYHEYMDVNQTQVVLLLSLNNLSEFERKYTVKVLNEILGGSSYSILFDRVREKKGYCYYINASIKPYDNIMIINSGVERENADKCIKLIRKCFKDVKDGKIDDNLISSSIKTIISGIKASYDNPLSIINTYYSKVLVGIADEEERIKCYQSVTKDNLVNVAKKITLHSVLTLEKGDSNEEDKD